MRTRHVLVRDVLEPIGAPDRPAGTVCTTQAVEVWVEWPDSLPVVPYIASAGPWRLVAEADYVRQSTRVLPLRRGGGAA